MNLRDKFHALCKTRGLDATGHIGDWSSDFEYDHSHIQIMWEGFQAGAASRNEELQRLQMALAEAEALELGTAEKCDQLRANIISLIGSLIRAANYIDVLGGTSGEYRKAVMLTPKQSITEYRNKVIEAFVNEFSRHVGGDGEFWLHELQDFAMKEQP